MSGGKVIINHRNSIRIQLPWDLQLALSVLRNSNLYFNFLNLKIIFLTITSEYRNLDHPIFFKLSKRQFFMKRTEFLNVIVWKIVVLNFEFVIIMCNELFYFHLTTNVTLMLQFFFYFR